MSIPFLCAKDLCYYWVLVTSNWLWTPTRLNIIFPLLPLHHMPIVPKSISQAFNQIEFNQISVDTHNTTYCGLTHGKSNTNIKVNEFENYWGLRFQNYVLVHQTRIHLLQWWGVLSWAFRGGVKSDFVQSRVFFWSQHLLNILQNEIWPLSAHKCTHYL